MACNWFTFSEYLICFHLNSAMIILQIFILGITQPGIVTCTWMGGEFLNGGDSKLFGGNSPSNWLADFIVSVNKRRRDIKILLSVDLRAEKFNVVSNDHGRTQNCDFSFLDRKYPFWSGFLQKSKLVFQFGI